MSESRMAREHLLLAAVAALVATPVGAQVIAYDPVYDDGEIAVLQGSVSEISLGSGSTTFGSSVALPPGYGAAEVALTDFAIQFSDGLSHPVRRVQLVIEPDPNTGGYDPSSGNFDWTITAALQSYPVPSNPNAMLNVSFVILCAKQLGAIVTRTILPSFTKVGGGTCDSSDACQNTSTLSGVGSATAPFQHALIGGFDLRLALAARALSMDQISVDVTNYKASNLDAVGRALIRFQGQNAATSAFENVSASVQLVSVARDLTKAYASDAVWYVLGQSTVVNHSDLRNSTTPGTAKGAYMGLQMYRLDTTSGLAAVQSLYAGCSNLTFTTAGGGTGRVFYQENYAMLNAQGSPNTLVYDGYTACRFGWLP